MKHDRTGRSKGEARHVRLYHWMIDSAAWRSLRAIDRAIYIEICQRFNGANNGFIAYSVREAAATFDIGKSTASRALERLAERGFIVATVAGSFGYKVRHSTRWRLTEHPSADGELPSKEFMRWSPSVPMVGPKKQKPVPVVKPYGTCGGTLGTCGETVTPKKGPHGTCGETVKGKNGPSSVPVVGQYIVYQGEELSTAPAERGRSAPTGSAVASPRVTPLLRKPSLTASQDGEKAA